MRCEELMTTPPEILAPDDTVADAARAMQDLDVGFLPVCTPDRIVVGTVTDRALVTRVLAERRPPDTLIQDVMAGPLVACRPDDDVRRAETLMREHHQGRIVCVDEDGQLIGIVSLLDITGNLREADPAREVIDVEVTVADTVAAGIEVGPGTVVDEGVTVPQDDAPARRRR